MIDDSLAGIKDICPHCNRVIEDDRSPGKFILGYVNTRKYYKLCSECDEKDYQEFMAELRAEYPPRRRDDNFLRWLWRIIKGK